jgi:hypothetical protein
MKVILYSLAITAVFVSGCVSSSKEFYRGYSGAELAGADLALLDMGKADWIKIDGMHFVHGSKYRFVKLLPGKHNLEWSITFFVSVLVDSRGIVEFCANSTVNFEAGHNYIIQSDRTFGPGYRVYIWIEDTSTGSVLVGEKKP